MRITIGIEFHRHTSNVSKWFYFYKDNHEKLFTLRLLLIFGITIRIEI
jgi:hypothetical protein